MVAYVRRDGYDFDDNDYRKTLSGMRIRVQGNVGDVMKWRFGGRDNAADPVDLEPAIDFTIGVDNLMDFFCDHRMISIEGKTLQGQPWQLSSMHPLAKLTGRW